MLCHRTNLWYALKTLILIFSHFNEIEANYILYQAENENSMITSSSIHANHGQHNTNHQQSNPSVV